MNVAVVGGGIGGLTAVLAIRRAGHEVVCFEQHPELVESGAGIQLGPNATRLLHRLGLEGALADVAVRPTRLQVRRWDSGAVIGELSGHPQVESVFGAPYYTVHRGDLHRVLAEAVTAPTVCAPHFASSSISKNHASQGRRDSGYSCRRRPCRIWPHHRRRACGWARAGTSSRTRSGPAAC
jgi:2-polyprenyl-6-methoxyphenol hydroxylase-like FAD-dependent oxidoreductase